MMEGTVIWWSEKGYGKVLGEDNVEYFIHYKGVEGWPEVRVNFVEGQRIQFDPTKNDRGPLAINVKANV